MTVKMTTAEFREAIKECWYNGKESSALPALVDYIWLARELGVQLEEDDQPLVDNRAWLHLSLV